MTYQRRIVAQVARLGQEVTVRVERETGTDDFGNPERGYADDRTLHALRTYPNRNTEVNTNRGDRHRDRPVFVIPKSDDYPAVPEAEDRLVYDGQTYEMQAPTHYETHVEYFGQIVRE